MKRVAELDAIRGIAALAIMVNHLPFSRWIFHAGAYGVDLFFVLSGYLITTIILKNSGSPRFMTAFYVRRSLRIWPIYYLALLGVIAVNPIFRPPYPLDGWPFYATYLQGVQDYWFGRVPPFSPLLDHTWTLALEEQYYLIWPALVVVLGGRAVAPLAIGLTLLSIGARSAGFSNRILLGRCDGFALGGLLAAILPDLATARAKARSYLVGFGLVALAAVAYPAWGGRVARLIAAARPSLNLVDVAGSIRLAAATFIFFAAVGVILILAGRPALRWLRGRTLCYLGTISYGIYLYHYPLYQILDATVGHPAAWWAIAIKFASTLGIASISWKYLEKPILSLKSRFDYRSGRDEILAKPILTVVEGPRP
jgi:peptidoglycan/LPS O-acetylase OafA/YrhL